MSLNEVVAVWGQFLVFADTVVLLVPDFPHILRCLCQLYLLVLLPSCPGLRLGRLLGPGLQDVRQSFPPCAFFWTSLRYTGSVCSVSKNATRLCFRYWTRRMQLCSEGRHGYCS